MESKKCGKCGQDFPATTDYFHKKKDRLDHRCKECASRIRAKNYNENREREKELTRLYYRKHQREVIEKGKRSESAFKEKYGFHRVTLHDYIRRRKLKPEYCQICNEKGRLELSSINHTYTRNAEDWIYLCGICHRLLDRLLKQTEEQQE